MLPDVNGLTSGHACQVLFQDITAHLCGHPLGLQQCMHAQAVQRCEEPFGFSDQDVLLFRAGRQQRHDQLPDDGGHRPVAARGFRSEHGFDPGSVAEGQPDADVHRPFFVEWQQLAKQRHDCLVPGRVPGRRRQDCVQRILEAAGDPLDHHGEGMDQQLIAVREIVPDGAHCQPGFIGNLPEGSPFQTIGCDDPEHGVDNVLAPGSGIYNFGHMSF